MVQVQGLGTFSALETTLLLSSATTWSFQLIVDAFSSGIRVGKVVENLREGNLLEESLPVTIFEAVGVLGSELMLFSSLSSEEKKDRILGEEFLKAEEGETLLKECLVMQ